MLTILLPSLPSLPSQAYSNTFYDNRMKNISRVARRYRDEPAIFQKLQIEHYDAEEIEQALRSKGLLEPLPPTQGEKEEAQAAGGLAVAAGAMKEIAAAMAATVTAAANREPVVVQAPVSSGSDVILLQQLSDMKREFSAELMDIRRSSVAGMQEVSNKLVEISKDEQALKEKVCLGGCGIWGVDSLLSSPRVVCFPVGRSFASLSEL